MAAFDYQAQPKVVETMIHSARELAAKAHQGQKYGDRPYMYHIEQVAELCRAYSDQAVVLAYLHDVVEDTSVTLKDIERQFGRQVAACIDILTDPPVKQRSERKAVSHQKLASVDAEGPLKLALIVKAADRLANMQSCVDTGHCDKLNTYLAEYPDFRLSAFRPGLCDPLWQRLDELSTIAAPA